MLDGWYCRSMADAAAAAEEEEEAIEESKCKKQYKFLKGKLKELIYENECFQESLRIAQKRLLVASRDRSFLLDRLTQLEKVESSSESDDTESSDEDTGRKRAEGYLSAMATSSANVIKKKRISQMRPLHKQNNFSNSFMPSSSSISNNSVSDGHMTPEEVERHLQSRQTYAELMPERAPLTVPTEMFSNEQSLDSESNDMVEFETSPSNMGEELTIDMVTE